VSPLPERTHAMLYAGARAASKAWEARSVLHRARVLGRVADRLAREADDVAALISEENGKPAVEALGHDVLPSVQYLRWIEDHAADVLAERATPLQWMPVRSAVRRRRAHGVVLVISPWNFPLAIPLAQVATALVAGNAVVLKPSEVTPRCADALAALFDDLPDGLLTVVHGAGDVGAALIDARPDKILFTGSLATGRRVMAAAAQHPIPVSLELGGVDAMIVREDADLELASAAAAWGATCNTGQVCASVERLLVHESVLEEFRLRLIDKLDRIEPRTDQGRPTLDRQVDVYRSHAQDAADRGLRIHGGMRGDRLAPTLVDGPGTAESLAWTEETFGPLVAMLPYTSDDDAVALHDGVGFGITASVFGRDVPGAEALGRRLRTGLVAINDVGATLYGHGELPWGGVDNSGFGRCKGEEGLLEATWCQVIEQARVPGIEPKKPWWYPYDHRQHRVIRRFVDLVAARTAPQRARALARMGSSAVDLLSRAPRT
jgi:acyl-CoA reductase-like NAD-dependent aldehyde dehydrogenase